MSIKLNINKANLLLIRDVMNGDFTLGKLYLNGQFMAHTLERPWIDNQRSVSCIPTGVYGVRLRTAKESASRDYLHLLVKDVPNRDYILFHKGNNVKDTKGCILTGLSRGEDYVAESRNAHTNLIDTLIENEVAENIELIIKNQ